MTEYNNDVEYYKNNINIKNNKKEKLPIRIKKKKKLNK